MSCRLFRPSVGLVACCCILIGAASRIHAQERGLVTVSGSATVSADVYSFSSNDSTQLPRRPSSLYRFIFTPTITIGDYITLPFNIMLSSQETNVVTPNAKNSTFLQFIQNPMNNLGVLSFSPRIGWFQSYLGTHMPQYSELSAGDEQIFGLGIDLTPGKFRFAASAGNAQRAIEPDSINGVRGAYARHIYMTKLGYGSEQSFLHLNVVRAKDDVHSLRRRSADLLPQEGLLVTTNFRWGFSEALAVTGEIGSSAFTRDMEADLVDLNTPLPSSMFKHRMSTRADYAGTLALSYADADWGVRVSSKYIGAGYVALGYPFMQPDRLEFLLAPRVRFLDRKVNVNASIGHRTNNLSETKGATSTQIIGSANVLALVTDELSFTMRYANFGMRNNLKNDTLKVENVSNSFSIAPTLSLRGETVSHTITVSYSIDAFTDYNVLSGAQSTNNTQGVMLMYLVSLSELPLSVNLMGNHMTNDLPTGALTINSIGAGVSSTLLDGRVSPSLNVSWTENALASFTADTQTTVRAGVLWRITEMLSFNTALSLNNYLYGSSKPGASFDETFFEAAITTSF